MRITIAGLCLLMFSALVWAGTWRDDFEDGDFEEWKVINGVWKVKDGELTARHATIIPAAQIEWKIAPLTDCTFEADVRFTQILADRSWVMMLFRPTQVWHYLAFRINRDGDGVVKSEFCCPGQASVRTPYPVFLDRWYHIKTTLVSDVLTVEVNGKLIHTNDWKDDNIPEKGTIGFAIGGGEAYIDDVIISGPEVPDGGPAQAVHPRNKLATTWGWLKAH